MKKYLLLVLCFCLLCTTLVGCSKSKIEEAEDIVNNTDINDGKRSKVTLNFYLMSEAAVSEEVLSEMQAQFNKIVEAKYTTHVVFTIVPADQYQSVLDNRMKDAVAGKEGTETLEGTDYPALKNNQLDIFLNISYENLKTNVQNGNLADISALLASKLRDFSNENAEREVLSNKGEFIASYNPTISEVLMNSSYFCTEVYENDGATTSERSEVFYGIPCSYPVGEYTYLAVNKKYADRFFLGDNFLPDISALADKEKALAAQAKLEAKITNEGGVVSDYIKKVTGDYQARFDLQYDENQIEYYVCVLEKPSISYEEICSAMFCISKYSANVERAFEVLYELNVNPELHTILQYGAEGLTYRLNNDSKTVSLLQRSSEYQLNLKHTGNYFNIFPLLDEDANAYDVFKYAELQNRDANCKGVIVHRTYKSRDTLGKYIYAMYDQAVANGAQEVPNGQENFVSIDEKTMTYQDVQYSVLYTAIRSTSGGKYSALVMEVYAEEELVFNIKLTATIIDSGYSFNIVYEDDNTSFTSAEFATLPNANKYLFDYTFQGRSQSYVGTLTVSASDYNSGVKLSVNDKTITITQDSDPTIEQMQEINASMNLELAEFINALDMFMVDSNTKLDASAFGFDLPETE